MPSSQDGEVKELSRKLYWAITSTLTLSRDQKHTTFSWCVRMAEGIIKRHETPPPPASRKTEKGVPCDGGRRGGLGLVGPSPPGALSRPSPDRLAAFVVCQRGLHERARRHVDKMYGRNGKEPVQGE